MVNRITLQPDGQVEMDLNWLAGLDTDVEIGQSREVRLDDEEPETLPDKLAAYRKRNNLTQKELAEILDVHPYTAGQWELGNRKPSAESLNAIRRQTDIEIRESANE